MSKDNICAIQVRDLHHQVLSGRTARCILDAVNLCVMPGQSVALIGRSGSGKSTLLNLISGLEPIQQGDVLLANRPMQALNDRERTRLRGREIGFIYQSFNLIPTLSVADNIALPLALNGLDKQKRNERLQALLTLIGLEGSADDYPDRLSGGEQQRVAIARALIHQPSVIMADEPTGNLDADSGHRVLSLLQDLVKQQQAALLLVTHSREVAAMADQVLLLQRSSLRPISAGELQQSCAW